MRGVRAATAIPSARTPLPHRRGVPASHRSLSRRLFPLSGRAHADPKHRLQPSFLPEASYGLRGIAIIAAHAALLKSVSHFCNAIDLTRSKQRAPYHHHHASESESDLESEANARTGRSDMLLPLIGPKPRPHLPFAREHHLPPQTNAEPAARRVRVRVPSRGA